VYRLKNDKKDVGCFKGLPSLYKYLWGMDDVSYYIKEDGK
jgi:hypothetical protein